VSISGPLPVTLAAAEQLTDAGEQICVHDPGLLPRQHLAPVRDLADVDDVGEHLAQA
jgi:hypothetical protein